LPKKCKLKNKISTLPAWMLKVLGFFIPFMGELYEMKYQFDRPFIFDSSKFNKRFAYKPMSNEVAVKELLQNLK
jgi:hypothetical protein